MDDELQTKEEKEQIDADINRVAREVFGSSVKRESDFFPNELLASCMMCSNPDRGGDLKIYQEDVPVPLVLCDSCILEIASFILSERKKYNMTFILRLTGVIDEQGRLKDIDKDRQTQLMTQLLENKLRKEYEARGIDTSLIGHPELTKDLFNKPASNPKKSKSIGTKFKDIFNAITRGTGQTHNN